MHEATLAAQVLRIADEALAPQSPPVRSVVVTVGDLSGVMIDALRFAFDALKKSTRFADAQMRVEKQSVVCACLDCGREYQPEGFPFVCPVCRSRAFRIIHGEEVFVKNLEVEQR